MRVRRPFACELHPEKPVFVSGYSRGRTYFNRAALEEDQDAKLWFDSTSADFTKAIERDGRHFMAWDMHGMVHSSTGECDKAINLFKQEMALNPLGTARLADAYCQRGSSRRREKNYGLAIADYEKAVEIGTTADGCSCDPHNPLVSLYVGESRQYDKAWEVVHKAQKSKRWIAPELLERLKRDSGHNDYRSAMGIQCRALGVFWDLEMAKFAAWGRHNLGFGESDFACGVGQFLSI